MRARIIFLLLLFTTFQAVPATAYVPEETPHRAAEAAARAAIGSPAAQGATAGIVLLRGEREIFSVNGGRPMAPASVLKLATTT
ncbi:MAG TPA: hypothetical protein VJ818_05025, partial [Actinomycetota bacterium]|nr:hypothetical protein [Actinomycetota bacterium]